MKTSTHGIRRKINGGAESLIGNRLEMLIFISNKQVIIEMLDMSELPELFNILSEIQELSKDKTGRENRK